MLIWSKWVFSFILNGCSALQEGSSVPPPRAPSRSPDQCWGNPRAGPSGALCHTVTKRDPSAHVEFTDLFVSAAAGNDAGMRGGSAWRRGRPAPPPGHLCGAHARVALRTGPGRGPFGRGCDILRHFHLPFVPLTHS